MKGKKPVNPGKLPGQNSATKVHHPDFPDPWTGRSGDVESESSRRSESNSAKKRLEKKNAK